MANGKLLPVQNGKIIAGVAISKEYLLRPKYRSVLTWLDIETTEYLDNVASSTRFDDNNPGRDKILGALKVMYLLDIITAKEYKAINNRIKRGVKYNEKNPV